MKKIFKYFTIAGLSGMLCLSLATNADAQRGGHGGGGGGFHGGGGGGFHGGGGGSFSGGNRGGFGGGGGFNGGGRTFSAPQGRSFNSAPQTRTFSAPQGRAFNSAPQNRSFNSTPNRSFYAAPQGRSYAGINRGYAGVGGRGYGSSRIGISGRASFIGPRSYVAGRGYIGRAYIGGRNYYGPWAGNRGYFYHSGFYSSLYYPRLGFRLGVLPYGYYPFWWNDAQFYYSDGYFYNYDGGQYTVVEPPVGAAVNSLPSNAKAININGTQYYESNGVYYIAVTKDDGSVVYQVAGKDGQLTTEDQGYDQGQYDQSGDQGQAPMGTHAVARIGDMIQQLPQDSRKIRVNGETLWVTPDDVYLKATTDENGQKVYTVVGTPDQQPQD